MMQTHRLPTAALLAGLLTAALVGAEARAAGPADLASTPHVWLDARGQPLPMQSPAELEELLRTARVVESEKTEHGRFGVRRLLLEKDGLEVHAAGRMMAEEDRKRRLLEREVWFFRDHYIHEPAAYALSELLGLGMVPPAVERSVNGKPASVQLWVEDCLVEIEREKQGVQPPDSRTYLLQLYQMYVFDNLINNIDRNLGNILFDPDWRVWLIDHSRAFIRDHKLPSPERVRRIERHLWERLRTVSDEELEAAIEPYLAEPERAALLERRRLLVELIEEKIAQVGEDGVLFSWTARAPAQARVEADQ
jgi:hypothetical protein